MPLYEYRCSACHDVVESLQRADVDVLACRTRDCPGVAIRQISRPTLVLDLAPYYDHGLDAVISSRAQRRRLMRAQGLVEKGTTHQDRVTGTHVSYRR